MKKITAILLIALMALAVIPCSALAQAAVEAGTERAKLALLDNVWDSLEEVENEAIEAGAEGAELVYAVYNAAINDPRVDAGSMGDVSARGFSFKVDGMLCAYNYVSRHVDHISAVDDALMDSVTEATEKLVNTKNGPFSMNVLLIGPYYGHDSSFTNQYRQEAQSIANVTGGTYTLIQSTNATGPAIANAIPNAGVVIYDSHGTAMSGTSYLCLTTNSGLTSTDYSNGWAYNGGSSDAGIDGRYIQNHITSPLQHCIIWMAICEGMKLSGHGVTGYALLEAGAGCVYGYSQSVTFAGDYVYEATFWNQIKNNDATVAEAFNVMTSTHGNDDPYGDAYPIVMSDDDPFPTNPDSHQTVYCDWTLFGGTPVDATGLSFAQDTYGLAPTFQLQLEPIVTPADANNYSKTWTTSDPSVATVSNKGLVTGISNGSATITYTIASTQYSVGQFSYSASVQVNVSNEYLPEEVMYVPVDTLVPGETYLIGYSNGSRNVIMGNEYQNTSNERNLKSVNITLGEIGGRTCVTSDVTSDQEWVWNADGTVTNVANGQNLVLNGNYLSMGAGSVHWTYAPNGDGETGTVTNDVNANFKYLGVASTNAYFGVFMSAYQIRLYRKLVRSTGDPIIGDVDGNGAVEASDALIVLRYAMGLGQAIPNEATADVNGDGVIDATDALLILRWAMGLAD